jgi:hypothetical protein
LQQGIWDRLAEKNDYQLYINVALLDINGDEAKDKISDVS